MVSFYVIALHFKRIVAKEQQFMYGFVQQGMYKLRSDFVEWL